MHIESEKLKIDLSLDELATTCRALDVYVDTGEAESEDGLAREELQALALRMFEAKGGRFLLTRDEAEACSRALGSLLYWEVSDPQDRDNAEVFYFNDPACPNSKMDRDDRSPEYIEECRKVDLLGRCFARLAENKCIHCGEPLPLGGVYCSPQCSLRDRTVAT